MVNVNEDVLEGLWGRALAQRPAHSLSEGGVEVAEAVVVARDIDTLGLHGKAAGAGQRARQQVEDRPVLGHDQPEDVVGRLLRGRGSPGAAFRRDRGPG